MEKNREEEETLKYFSRALKLSFNFLKALVGILIIFYLFSGFFTIKQDEVGIILRWGKIVGVGKRRILKPGFHWAYPPPIDKVVRIPVRKIKSVDIKEFWSPDLDKKNISPSPFLIPWLHGYIITGDENIIHTSWHVEYQIQDPLLYITNIKDEKTLIKDAVCNAIISIISNFSVDEALRTRLENASTLVKIEAQKRLDSVDSGISIIAVYLDRSVPPLQVANAFNRVIKAEQIKSSKINEAKSYANRVINTARGKAAKILSDAQTYKNAVVNESLADAEYIEKLTHRFKEGSKSLEVYLAYFYQERMEDVLLSLRDKFILQMPLQGKENELRIILGKEKKWRE